VLFLSKVEDVFQISGRGCVVVPAVPGSSVDFQLRTHDSIQLRNPDGRVLDTYIAGIEMVCGQKVRDRIAFLLPGNITTHDVPKETEIWLIQKQ
jgi:translation elongation factor EF-Tu-like GTPase